MRPAQRTALIERYARTAATLPPAETDTDAFLTKIDADLSALTTELANPADERDYRDVSNRLTKIVARSAAYAAAVHATTIQTHLRDATAYSATLDPQQDRPQHWDDYLPAVNQILDELTELLTGDPELTTPEEILATLAALSGWTLAYHTTAYLTRNDRDPHPQSNFATYQARSGKWIQIATHCDPGQSPAPPTFAPDRPNETICTSCYGYSRSMQPLYTAYVPLRVRRERPYEDKQTGLLTAASAAYWTTLAATVLAAREYQLPIAIVDDGLTPDQHANLTAAGVTWLTPPVPNLPDLRPPHHAVAPANAWRKPWYCLASPWPRTLWIDADAILTRDPRHYLMALNHRLHVSTVAGWPASWETLYDALRPLAYARPPQARDNDPAAALNSGVLAWRAGNYALQIWAAATRRILGAIALANASHVRDQSALYLAIAQDLSGPQHFSTWLPNDWNVAADHLTPPNVAQRRPIPANPRDALALTRQRHPEAVIVHWLGNPKPTCNVPK